MNLQSILLLVLLSVAFLLALKKSKTTSCSGSCPNCPNRDVCEGNSKKGA